ncbi:MAG: amino acid adenylation domain-containing protein, partial [Cyanobacteria bacterium P01_G01_bin.38]
MLAEIKRDDSSDSFFSEKIYWLNQLSGELPETAIITDYLRPESYGKKNRSVRFDFSRQCSQAVISFSKASYSSVYVFLLAAVYILLEKYTNNSDLIVGIPVCQEANFKPVANKVLPLRTRIAKDLTFEDALLQVRDRVVSAYIHPNYPVDKLFPLLGVPQYQNRCPIFDIVVLLENIHVDDETLDLNNDLTFSFEVNGNCISGKIDYSDSLFRDDLIRAIAKHYVNIVECIVEHPGIKLSDIAFLKEKDRQQLLRDFNPSRGTYPIEHTIDELFEKQVERTPDHIVAVWENTRLTYRALNAKANQLAGFLKHLGLEPGEFVGILKDRDINFLIAILAIYKAGAAYVPIDSTYPADRIKYMLSNSEVSCLLTDSLALKRWDNFTERPSKLKHVICLDVNSDGSGKSGLGPIGLFDQRDFDQLSQKNLSGARRSANPAYMLYTSGSTGWPKGAIIRHDGAINHIYAQLDALEVNKELNFLQSAPASSDISVWQFLAPLLTGGKTVIASTETVCSPDKLFELIKAEKIALVELVPVVLKGLIDYVAQLSVDQRSLPDLTLMMVTGEYVPVELINQWLSIYPSIKVANAYGPTEAADDIAQFITDKPLPKNQRTVPIGQPLANLRLYILDAQMQLVPIGAPGEICVSGIGVGNGYWKNEAKTCLSFVPNPFSSRGQSSSADSRDLIYKTGDLGRWLPDGNLEFLGRIDNQVKIRGFRIELGEIEALLSQYPSVQDAVAIVREDSPGNQSLVAYIVKSADNQLSRGDENTPNALAGAANHNLSSQLRDFLKQKLPDPMVPSAFIPLERLPLTPSGKVDRRALPQPEQTRPKSERPYTAPSTAIEKAIAEIWQQILGIERVSLDDSFFELGGHSLLITQLFTRLRNTFEVNITLRSLFDLPTIADIAQEIKRIQQTPTDHSPDEEQAIDFEAEAVLDSTIQPEGLPQRGLSHRLSFAPAAIFLTGSTGFLGSFLLYELLKQTRADIYCLVRSSDIESGGQKIQHKLESYLLWDDAFRSRIIPVVGDLSQPLLGLSEPQFETLAAQLDMIYHSGARVNSMSPYQTFRVPNVLGTQEVLRLACQSKVKPFHFVSSTGVVSSGQADAGSIQEDSRLDAADMPSSGYAQSKRVAEKLVTIARDRGLPVCIYRPGFVTGHSQKGLCNTDDIIYRMIKGCIQIKSIPNLEVNLDLNPCDYVSQAIVYLSNQVESWGKVFHLVNPQPLSMGDIFQYVHSLGYPIEFVDYRQWRTQLVNEGNSPDNALYPLIPIFAGQEPVSLEEGGVKTPENPTMGSPTYQQAVQPFDASNTLTGLANSAIVCPTLDNALLDTYFSYLIQSGFL